MKIFFLTIGNMERASSRTRVFQYLPHLKRHGIKYRIFLNSNKGFFKSCLGIYYALISDIIFMQKVTDLSQAILFLLKLFNKKIIYDFDDAIFNSQYKNNKQKNEIIGNLCQRKKKFINILNIADHIITNNIYNKLSIEKYLSSLKKVSIILSPINIDKLHPKTKETAGKIVIGWIGQPCNVFYLNNLNEVFKILTQRFENLIFKIIGINNFKIEGMPIICKNWNLNIELKDLQSFDIGIMPLPDNGWTRGKGGYKLLQYMAVGIPYVASPIGVNKEITKEGINGFLASSNEEWIEKLSLLIKKPQLRYTMGRAGRQIAEEKHSVKANFPKLLKIFQEIHKK